MVQAIENEGAIAAAYIKDGTRIRLSFVIEGKGSIQYIDTDGTPVKYSLKGKDGEGNDLSIGESTLCFKGDYMSSDHANTFNANLADTLYQDTTEAQEADPRVQNTVYGIRCLLFQRDDENAQIRFVADGALNNDKGNNKTFGLECAGDLEDSEGNPTNISVRQKWEFLNNTEALCSFQTDNFSGDTFDLVMGNDYEFDNVESHELIKEVKTEGRIRRTNYGRCANIVWFLEESYAWFKCT